MSQTRRLGILSGFGHVLNTTRGKDIITGK